MREKEELINKEKKELIYKTIINNKDEIIKEKNLQIDELIIYLSKIDQQVHKLVNALSKIEKENELLKNNEKIIKLSEYKENLMKEKGK